MFEQYVGGHQVLCTRSDLGIRIWHCDCPDYDRRLVTYGEGFCVHLVLAIEHAILEDQIPPPTDR